MREKIRQKKKLSPIVMMLFLIVFVSILSLIGQTFNIESSITSITNGELEKSMVVIKSIFSKEGIIYLLSNLTTNFSLLNQLILIIISLATLGIFKSSGLFKQIFRPLKRMSDNKLTFITIFICIISSIISDYSYIILIPLIASLYQYLNKNPILGVVISFIGITLGYATGIIFSFDDYSLGVLTQMAASIDVDPDYKYKLSSNLYIMLVTCFIMTTILTILSQKYLNKEINALEIYHDESQTSKKALMVSLISLVIMSIMIIIGILPNGVLLDNTQDVYIAKLFSANSPFNLSFMYILLFIISVMSLIYGFISKNFKDNQDYSFGFTKEFDNVGYLFILMFLLSLLSSIMNWTNISTVLVTKLLYLIEVLNFTGAPLIVLTFVIIIIMTIFMPNSLEKWTLISPTLIPLFMKGNISPDFAQFLFRVSDSIGKSLTPLYIFFMVAVGFIQKYNNNSKKISLFDITKKVFPILLTTLVIWLLILIIWYISGLPLGIGTYAAM